MVAWTVDRRLLAAAMTTLGWLCAPAAGQDRAAALAEARAAVKGGDVARAKSIAVDLLKADPDSLTLRLELGQIAESRNDAPGLAAAHYAEIVAAGERAAKGGQKVSEEDARALKEASLKLKTIADPFPRDVAKALKAYADAGLKTARAAKAKKHWSFSGEIARTVKTLFGGLPGVLDPKDPREAEATKHWTDALAKRAEDNANVPNAFRAEVSVAVAALGSDLSKLADSAAAVYEEVRGPLTRRRALLPMGILISLGNDPAGNAKKAEALWASARTIEPTRPAKLRFATNASQWSLCVNGERLAAAGAKSHATVYREFDVRLFQAGNLIGFYGHEVAEVRPKGRPEWVSRSAMFVDIPLTDKEHITTDATWNSFQRPSTGWDLSLDGCFDSYPVLAVGKDLWDYENTKTWTGSTLIGDAGDTYLRKAFDIAPAPFQALGGAPKADAGAPVGKGDGGRD